MLVPIMTLIGDIANSKCPLLIIPKVQLRLRVTHRGWQKLLAGKNFVKNLVTAQTQLRSYSEQQRHLEIATSAIEAYFAMALAIPLGTPEFFQPTTQGEVNRSK